MSNNDKRLLKVGGWTPVDDSCRHFHVAGMAPPNGSCGSDGSKPLVVVSGDGAGSGGERDVSRGAEH